MTPKTHDMQSVNLEYGGLYAMQSKAAKQQVYAITFLAAPDPTLFQSNPLGSKADARPSPALAESTDLYSGQLLSAISYTPLAGRTFKHV
jgi:hypothetical protein